MNDWISKDLSCHVEKLGSLIENHKIAKLLLSNSIFFVSIALRDPITYELYSSCLRGADCSHFEVLNENTLNLLKRPECPICEEKSEKFTQDDYLFEIISFLKKNNLFFESLLIDLKTGIYLPISTEPKKIDFDYFFILVCLNEANIKEKGFNYTDEKISNVNNVFYVSLRNENNRKIKFPIRLKSCKHIEFFDLEEIYESSLQKVALDKIQCPFCFTEGNAFEIYMDSKFFGINKFIWDNISNKEIPEMNIQGLYFYPSDDLFRINELCFNNKFKMIKPSNFPSFINFGESERPNDPEKSSNCDRPNDPKKISNNNEKYSFFEEFPQKDNFQLISIPNKQRQIQELPYYEF